LCQTKYIYIFIYILYINKYTNIFCLTLKFNYFKSLYNKHKWWPLVVHKLVGSFLTSSGTISFSRSTVLHGVGWMVVQLISASNYRQLTCRSRAFTRRWLHFYKQQESRIPCSNWECSKHFVYILDTSSFSRFSMLYGGILQI
jgi:hypothetical protein